MPISPLQGQCIPMRRRNHSPSCVCLCVCVCVNDKDNWRVLSCVPTVLWIFFHPSSFFWGSLLLPVHISLIKPSTEELMHNFIRSSSTWGHFLTSLKIYDSFLSKDHNSRSVAGVGVTDAKWAIYRFLVEGEFCVESFQNSYAGYLTPRGFICSPWYI